MFDPIAIAARFEHVVVDDVEAAAKHADVKAALVAAASALLPGLNLPQDVEDVTALLKAAGEVVHRAIDVQSASKTVAAESNVPAPPAGYSEPAPATPSAAGTEAPGTPTGSPAAVDGAAADPAQGAAAPPATA